MDNRLESLFTFLCLVSGIYFTLLFLWYALVKIKERDKQLRLERIKNPKPREKTTLERIEERNIIIQKRRDLRK